MAIKTSSFANQILIDFGMNEDELLDDFGTDNIVAAASVFAYGVVDQLLADGLADDYSIAYLEDDNCVIRYKKWTIGFGPSEVEEGSLTPYEVVEFIDEDSAKNNIKQLEEV